MRIMVTGGSGVIGKPLIEKLIEQGHDVYNVDLAPPIDGVIHYRYDITLMQYVKRAFKQIKPDRVYHLAAGVGRIKQENDPLVVATNITGTYNVAMNCVDYGAELIYLSTSEVYGDHDGKAVSEGDATNPINLYGATKLAAEVIIQYMERVYDLRAMIVRPFMVYGGEGDSIFRSALSQFFYALKNYKPLRIDRGCVRSWCYVSDFVRGITTNFVPGIFNVGNDTEPIDMVDLYEKQAAIAGVKGRANIRDNMPDKITVRRKQCNLERARIILEYEPEIKLTGGLLKTWEAMV